MLILPELITKLGDSPVEDIGVTGRLGVPDRLVGADLGQSGRSVLSKHYRRIDIAELRMVSGLMNRWRELAAGREDGRIPANSEASAVVSDRFTKGLRAAFAGLSRQKSRVRTSSAPPSNPVQIKPLALPYPGRFGAGFVAFSRPCASCVAQSEPTPLAGCRSVLHAPD